MVSIGSEMIFLIDGIARRDASLPCGTTIIGDFIFSDVTTRDECLTYFPCYLVFWFFCFFVFSFLYSLT